jgi:hypothetical protein
MKIMCPRASCKEKYEKITFFCILKSLKKGVRSGSVNQRGTDLRIRIRTKMSGIPNTGFNIGELTTVEYKCIDNMYLYFKKLIRLKHFIES